MDSAMPPVCQTGAQLVRALPLWNQTPKQSKGDPMRPGRCLSATIWLFLSLAATGTAVAQNPFVGTWKLNQEKSQLAGDTMKFGPAEGDAIELTAGGITYSFRVDGKNYALPIGQRSHLETDQPR